MPYVAVAASSDDSFTVVNVANPAAPVVAGSIQGAGAPPFLDQCLFAYVSGVYAYVVSYTEDALSIFDISDPANPVYVGSVVDHWALNGATRVFVRGNYAYVTAYLHDRLVIIDITNPAAPFIVSEFGGAGAPNWMDGATGVFVRGDYAYVVSDVDDSLTIINISNPALPTLVSNLHGAMAPNWLNGAVGIFVDGNYAYVAARDASSLSIFDVTNPAAPFFVGRINGNGPPNFLSGANSVVILGIYAYVTTHWDMSLTIVDVTNPAAPAFVGVIAGIGPPNFLNSPRHAMLEGNYAYVAASADDSLTIIDITNPAAPAFVANIQGAGAPTWMGTPYGSFYFPGTVAPTVSTDPASGVTLSSATLNGTLNSDGGLPCDVRFEYGTAPGALLFSTPWQSGFVSGNLFNTNISLPTAVTYFRAVARNAVGTSYGAVLSVLGVGANVITLPATGITENTATINGYLQNDGGSMCEVRFQWGVSSFYGTDTPWISGRITGDAFSAALTDLPGGVLHHFRTQARMGGAIYNGNDMAFVTITPAHMTLLTMELAQKLGG